MGAQSRSSQVLPLASGPKLANPPHVDRMVAMHSQKSVSVRNAYRGLIRRVRLQY